MHLFCATFNKRFLKPIFSGTLLFSMLLMSPILRAQLPADSINAILKSEVDHHRSPGIAVGVIDPKGKYFYGYGTLGDSTSRVPDEYTVYEIGSISKVFTALLLADMSLKEEVKLYDPISRYLPDSVHPLIRNGREITLMDLTTQTSGLPRMPDNFMPKNWSNPYADYTRSQLFHFLAHYKLTRDIGSKYEYSNLGVGLLGNLLSMAVRTDYETLLKERICKPLGLKNTGITLTDQMKAHLAPGHDGHGTIVGNWDLPAFAGAAAIRSDVHDMLLFLQANLGQISSKLDQAMKLTQRSRDSTGVTDLSIAMGWHIWKKYGHEIIWHNGGTGGYRSFAGFDKASGTAIVVLSNSANSVDDIALHILNDKFALKPYQP